MCFWKKTRLPSGTGPVEPGAATFRQSVSPAAMTSSAAGCVFCVAAR